MGGVPEKAMSIIEFACPQEARSGRLSHGGELRVEEGERKIEREDVGHKEDGAGREDEGGAEEVDGHRASVLRECGTHGVQRRGKEEQVGKRRSSRVE